MKKICVVWLFALAVSCSRANQETPTTEAPASDPPSEPKPKAKKLKPMPMPELVESTPTLASPTATVPAPTTKPTGKVVSVIDLPGGLWSPWKLPDLKDLGLPPLPTLTIPLPPTSAKPVEATGPSVILYGAEWCPHCKTAKEHIAKRGIAYTYRNVDEEEASKEMTAKLQKAGISKGGIPTTDVDGDLLVGWNADQFDKMYDAKAKK